jgi:hypothetical protein
MMPRSTWLVCFVAMTELASAQPAGVQAEALFRQGKDLMAQKKFAEACAAFESSHKLDPSVATLLNHADCREKNGQLATSWGLFLEAERQTRARSDAASKQLNGVAASRAGKLEARMSKLSINVAADRQVAGLEVLRGTALVDAGTWNHSLPIDGGTYKITARAPGHAEWSTTVTVKPERDAQVVEVPRLESAPVVAPVTPTGPSEDPNKTTGPIASIGATTHQTDQQTKRSLVAPIAFGAAAIVLGGTAFGFARWGDSIYDDAKREPDDARQETLWKSANKRRYAAIGFTVGAVGCVGAAIYLYVRGGRETDQAVARRTMRVEPMASASALGLGLGGSW